MHAKMIIILAVAFSSTALFAQDRSSIREKIQKAFLETYDANGNGELDENEKATIVKTYDANGNGKLDQPERSAAIKAIIKKRNPQADTESAREKTDEKTNKWNTTGFRQANTMGGGEATILKDGKFRVFVLMGQSNMHGAARAADLKSPYNQKHDRIRIWANGRWEHFVPRSRFGPGVSMAHQLAEKWPNDTIGIIKIASGGTGIRGFEKNWTKERADRTFDGKKGSLYKDLMNAVTDVKHISKLVFCGFVWKQGGADGTKKDLADEYYDTFKQLVSDLRKDLGASDMPVFVLTYAS
jgi:hypothetical protein